MPRSTDFSAYCAVLGLRTVRTVEELDGVYRPLIAQWHPDRHYGRASYAMAAARAAAINEAYAFLLAALERERERERERAQTVAPRPGSHAARDGFPDPTVLEIFVKAPNIISVGYNSSTADLFVKYLGHRIYRYRAVPASVVEALLNAPSASTFVSEHIDREFESEAYKRIT
ncbi:KTSC domain-containing protein [Gemmatimonas sp.]|uniref:KTSC domain-containing protein n=1 Tax=Gemmatimonas sp. TaxID=1962908 RepID=UPI00286E8690|nr:KTSC domain-containing protein [Gemmatimonas sp.]